jgi:hypothetical protein
MHVQEFEGLWKELGHAIYMGFHDGGFDPEKEPWEQDYAEMQRLWRRITHPENREALLSKIGTGGNPDGERMIREAYRQSVVRFIEAFPDSDELKRLKETGTGKDAPSEPSSRTSVDQLSGCSEVTAQGPTVFSPASSGVECPAWKHQFSQF